MVMVDVFIGAHHTKVKRYHTVYCIHGLTYYGTYMSNQTVQV